MKTQYFKREEIAEYAKDGIENLIGYDSTIEGAELHNELFNTDYFIIGTYQAKQWLGDNAFEAIEIIKEYEQDNFGEVSTDLSDPEKVVNMYAYIVGEAVLSESPTLQNNWDKTLTNEHLKHIKDEIA